MNWNWTTSWKWHRLLVALLIAAAATAIRAMFFEGLGRGIPYLTYYPAVMLAYLGQTTPKAKTFDLAKVCHDVIETQRSFIPPRVALKVEIPSHGPTIKASQSQVRQVFSNLIVNAWEAIGEGDGDIQVSLRIVEALEMSSRHICPVGWKPERGTYA